MRHFVFLFVLFICIQAQGQDFPDIVEKVEEGSILTKEEQKYIDDAIVELDQLLLDEELDYLEWQLNQQTKEEEAKASKDS